MGRPTKLTPELQEAICEEVRNGIFPETAAQKCGVHRATWYRWQALGRDGEEPYSDLCDAVARARAEAEIDLVKTVNIHARMPKGAQAAQWLLERLNRERFGPQIRVQVASELERYLDAIEKVLEPEQFDRVLEAIAAADDSPQEIGEATVCATEH